MKILKFILKIVFWGFLTLMGVGSLFELIEKIKAASKKEGLSVGKILVRNIPGYRSNTKWKKIVATIYYVVILTSLLGGFSLFLFMLSLPFLITSTINLFKPAVDEISSQTIASLFLVSLLMFSVGLHFIRKEGTKDIAENSPAITSQEEDSQDDELKNDIEEDKEDEKNTKVNHIANVDNENKSSDSSPEETEESGDSFSKSSSSGEDSSANEGPKETTSGGSSDSSNNAGNPSNANFEDKSETDKEFQYVGNSSTKKFHYTYCGSAEKISEGNRAYFNSRDEAINKGYVPCKRCNP